MEYPQVTREVFQALLSAREEDDEAIWWDRAVLELCDLLPTSAIAWALHQPEVWRPDLRQDLRRNPTPGNRNGFTLGGLVEQAETEAAADGSHVMSEVYIARAIAKNINGLQQLGISAEALVAKTTERCAPLLPPRVPARPRVIGSERTRLLQESVSATNLIEILSKEEGSGVVERKRSLIVREGDLSALEHVAVALVNGSPEAPVYIVFGQEDDGTLVGQLDWSGKPIDDVTAQKHRRRIDQRLQNTTPPLSLKWEPVDHDGKRIWIACLLGRARGTAVRTSLGSYPYRSGEDTYLASPEKIVSWQREPTTADAALEAESIPSSEHGPQTSLPEPVAKHRDALLSLRESVRRYFEAPPPIPPQINQPGLLESWRPVYEPILQHFQSAIDQVVDVAITLGDESLGRLFRGIRSIFELHEPRGGSTWVIEAPRLVCRLIADRVIVEAYATERWGRIPIIARPAFDSYVGRVPWVVAPEYRSLETLGRHSTRVDELILSELVKDHHLIPESGATEGDVRAYYFTLTLALAICYLAFQERRQATNLNPPWVFLNGGVAGQMIAWEEEPAILHAFALLAGEDSEVFSSQLADRFTAVASAYQAIRGFVAPDPAWSAIDRITKRSREILDKADVARRRSLEI